MATLIDPNGERVLAFTGRIRNLARVAELTDSIVEIAGSGVWRDYRTAIGHEHWEEAELDYFLIACDMHYDDVSRVLAWNVHAAALAPMMDRDADQGRRRSLEEASAAWHSPTGETLVDRARRLGWLGDGGRLHTPIPPRARSKATHGLTMDEQARRGRMEKIPPERRRELDTLAANILADVGDTRERRYLVDRLVHDQGGRPTTSPAELAAWRADAEELHWNTSDLAKRWGIGESGVLKRKKRLQGGPEAASGKN